MGAGCVYLERCETGLAGSRVDAAHGLGPGFVVVIAQIFVVCVSAECCAYRGEDVVDFCAGGVVGVDVDPTEPMLGV